MNTIPQYAVSPYQNNDKNTVSFKRIDPIKSIEAFYPHVKLNNLGNGVYRTDPNAPHFLKIHYNAIVKGGADYVKEFFVNNETVTNLGRYTENATNVTSKIATIIHNNPDFNNTSILPVITAKAAAMLSYAALHLTDVLTVVFK